MYVAKRLALPVACLFLLAFAATASADRQIFMKISGMRGDSLDDKYTGAAQLTSFKWALHNDDTSHGGTTSARPKFDQFEVTKAIDSSSTYLFEKAGTDAHISSVRIAIRKDGATSGSGYLQYCLEEATVSSYSIQGGATDAPSEHISFNPDKVEMRYVGQGSGGTTLTLMTGWDIVSATPISFTNNCAGITN